jgi:hypothetical protein
MPTALSPVPARSSLLSRGGLAAALFGLAGVFGAGPSEAQVFSRSEVWHSGSPGLSDGSVEPRAEFGSAVAAGDFNCDGFDDLAIGQPLESRGGAVYVLFGSELGLRAPAQRWTERQILGQGPDALELFGHALAPGDFDGDGCADLAIGAPLHVGDSHDFGTDHVGAFHVLYGVPGLGLANVPGQSFTQDTAGVIGECEPDQFGWALAAGDFDQDGFSDLAVGVPFEGLDGAIFDYDEAGAVQIFYGSSLGITVRGNQWIDQSAGLGGVAIAGDVGDDDHFGESVVAGDWNGDGASDLAIGVPGDFESQPGAVEVIFGVKGYGLHGERNFLFSQNSAGVLDDDERMDHFGTHLGGGDFDRDGFDELLVGVWSEDDSRRLDTGAMHLFPGSAAGPVLAGDRLFTQAGLGLLEGPEQDDRFGGPFAAGDLDGDGTLDLAVSAPEEDLFGFKNAGAVHLLFGMPGGSFDLARSVALHQANEGPEPRIRANEEFGDALSLGDFDGDGRADLAVGVRLDVIEGLPGAGSVNVFYGFDVK